MTNILPIKHPFTRVPSVERFRLIALLLLAILALPAMAADSLHVSMQVSNYNGFQVSCFGEKDGWINLTVSGGEPPYAYKWSNGSIQQDPDQLAAGYYKVDVVDHGDQVVTMEVTLNQPLPMKPDVDVYEYPNGYNISCYDCNNGNASVMMLGGAPPFTVSWSDGPTGPDRYNLGPKDYKITITDANGCAGVSTTIYLRGPARSDWSMSGNPGTTPGPQYLGTSDNKDVVFKSYGQERLRLLANGDIKALGFAASGGCGLLYVDEYGIMKRAGGGPDPVCTTMPWYLGGNDNVNEFNNRIGTNVPVDLLMVTGTHEQMRITVDGKVGIGTNPPAGVVGDYRLFVENGIVCRDVLVKLGTWPDYVFQEDYTLKTLPELREYLAKQKHLPGIPSAAELQAKQGVELGNLQTRMLKVVEEQALYILQLEENQSEMEQRLQVLEASQR